MARGRDSLDHLIERWALVRRELLGWREPNQAWQCLGAPHCTLSTVRDHYDGAGQWWRSETALPRGLQRPVRP